jgi:hypothetical protein
MLSAILILAIQVDVEWHLFHHDFILHFPDK